MFSRKLVLTAGVSCGHVMCLKSFQPVAPSTAGPQQGQEVVPVPSSRRTVGGTERELAVAFRNGRVSGDTGRVRIGLGQDVRVAVTSDVADEVHLHGYDRRVNVPAGGTVTLEFTANLPGVFEVELESRRRQLLSLQIS